MGLGCEFLSHKRMGLDTGRRGDQSARRLEAAVPVHGEVRQGGGRGPYFFDMMNHSAFSQKREGDTNRQPLTRILKGKKWVKFRSSQ